MLKRLLAAFGFVLVLAACSPEQNHWYSAVKDAITLGNADSTDAVEAPMTMEQLDAATNAYIVEANAATAGHPCPNLYDYWQAAFRDRLDLWPAFAYIFDRETGHTCLLDPLGGHRLSRTSDAGYAQINHIWFVPLQQAGIITSYHDLFDGYREAQAVRYVFDRQGLTAWCTWHGGCR